MKLTKNDIDKIQNEMSECTFDDNGYIVEENQNYVMDASKLDNTSSSDIFGYLMAVAGVTKLMLRINIVAKLYTIRSTSDVYRKYIDTILDNIINYNSMDDYMVHLSSNKNEFISTDGEVLKVNDMSEVL